MCLVSLGKLRKLALLSSAARCVLPRFLSVAMERLLTQIQFNGKVSVIVQNGRVLKSGYEEGYFGHNHGT